MIQKTIKNMEDDTWKKKGHAHPKKESTPEVCYICFGTGSVYDKSGNEFECPFCEGLGEIYE